MEQSARSVCRWNDPMYSSLRCLVLQGLVKLCQPDGQEDKDTMKKMVETHGGTYMPTLEQEVAKVTIYRH